MASHMNDGGSRSETRSLAALVSIFAFVTICAVCLLGVRTPVLAQDAGQPLEQQIKAAYLFKFGGYVEWPANAFADAGAPLVIGIVGDEALAREVTRAVGNRTINGRAVVVHSLQPTEPIPRVHILFVSRAQLPKAGDFAAAARTALVVTDADRGLDQGGVINFVAADNRVRFEVSLDAAKRSGLKIGAPLLSVAMRVQG
jgi:uncharacterized protein DUF4154